MGASNRADRVHRSTSGKTRISDRGQRKLSKDPAQVRALTAKLCVLKRCGLCVSWHRHCYRHQNAWTARAEQARAETVAFLRASPAWRQEALGSPLVRFSVSF